LWAACNGRALQIKTRELRKARLSSILSRFASRISSTTARRIFTRPHCGCAAKRCVPQDSATDCYTAHAATCRYRLQQTATDCEERSIRSLCGCAAKRGALQHTATHRHTVHTAAHCNTPQHMCARRRATGSRSYSTSIIFLFSFQNFELRQPQLKLMKNTFIRETLHSYVMYLFHI